MGFWLIVVICCFVYALVFGRVFFALSFPYIGLSFLAFTVVLHSVWREVLVVGSIATAVFVFFDTYFYIRIHIDQKKPLPIGRNVFLVARIFDEERIRHFQDLRASWRGSCPRIVVAVKTISFIVAVVFATAVIRIQRLFSLTLD